MLDFTSSKQQPTRIDHFAVGVDRWIGAERALVMVQKRLPAARARIVENPVAGRPDCARGPGHNAKELEAVLVTDPDGITVQICHPKYQLI